MVSFAGWVYSVVSPTLVMVEDVCCPAENRRQAPGVGTFERIYHDWFEEVGRWIRALGGPDADRDDIAQEVFIVVRRRLCAFDGANLAGWLYRITAHQVRDFRRRTWISHIFTRSRLDEPDTLPDADQSPASALEHKENQRVLYEILNKLRESHRNTFILFEIEGISGERIAQLQGVPLNTVWTRLHHARRAFSTLAAKQRKSHNRDKKKDEAPRKPVDR